MTEKQLIMIIVSISFLFALAVMSLEHIIVTKIKNKAQRRTRKQITYRYAKIDLYDYLTCKMKQEFIGQRKVILNELVRM